MLTIQEIRALSKKELLLELQKARKEMLKVRINLKTKHDKDTSKSRQCKVTIARILTALNEIERSPKAEEKVVKASEAVAEKPAKTPKATKTVAKKS
jgi:ribosomal protein L29